MTKHSFILIFAIQFIGSLCATCSADEKNAEKKAKVAAKSHTELARLVATAFDNEDYDTIAELMLPLEIVKKMGAPEEALIEYSKYLSTIRESAKEYRMYLKDEEHLPLRKARFQALEAKEPEKINGMTVIKSGGVRLENDHGAYFQLVDIAFSIDGVWYIAHLRNTD